MIWAKIKILIVANKIPLIKIFSCFFQTKKCKSVRKWAFQTQKYATQSGFANLAGTLDNSSISFIHTTMVMMFFIHQKDERTRGKSFFCMIRSMIKLIWMSSAQVDICFNDVFHLIYVPKALFESCTPRSSSCSK